MLKKSNIIFPGLFLLFYFSLQFFFRFIVERQEKIDTQQTYIIQENVKERFNTFLKLPEAIGLLGADIFSTGNLKTRPYGSGLEEALINNQEILGLSIMDHEGRIVRVNPVGSNPTTVGKISQNTNALMSSFAKGEKYWLSSPMQLFQGPIGFALYVPIVEKNNLKGWFATVISTELFSEKFELAEYSHVYDLTIKDELSGMSYFTTFGKPYNNAVMHKLPVDLLNRKMLFLSWRKRSEATYHFPWWLSFTLAVGLTVLLKFITYLMSQRKKAHGQLNDINSLLHLTSSEALSKLVETHNKFNTQELTENQKQNFSEAVTYLKHLIEQIDLLQTMSLADEEHRQDMHGFLPLLKDQLNHFHEIIEQKNLEIKFDQSTLDKVLLSTEGWPLQISVLASILSHSIIYAKKDSLITIDNKSSDDTYYITFHAHNINAVGPDGEATNLDRRLEVAKRILQIYKGQLFIQNDLSEGMLIRIILPIHS